MTTRPAAGPHAGAGRRGFSARKHDRDPARALWRELSPLPPSWTLLTHTPPNGSAQVTACARRVPIALNGRLHRAPRYRVGHVPAQVIMVSRDQVIRCGCAIVAFWLTLRDPGGPSDRVYQEMSG